MGHKRVWPYRFDAQERALMGGMRGAGFSALLGLDDFRKDAAGDGTSCLLYQPEISPRGAVLKLSAASPDCE